MSLATRCTHCGTIFKVVQDQLKVSDGWVRCGRCHEVFHALPTLFDLDKEAPPPRPAATGPGTGPAADPPPPAPQTPSPVAAAKLLRQREPAQALPTEPSQAPPLPAFLRKPPAETPLSAPPAFLSTAPAAPPSATDFELDTAIPLRSPPEGGDLAPPSTLPEDLPQTDEADALDSRYLLPSRSTSPARRRPRGPEFADAEFPDDAWLDLPQGAPEGLHSAPEPIRHPGTAHVLRSEAAHAAPLAAPPHATPSPPRAPRPMPPVPGVHAHDTDGASTLPSRHAEDFVPEPVLPPPSARSGKPGTRGRDPAQHTPEFVRKAQRQAAWRHPLVRSTLALLLALLTAGLALQVAHLGRDHLAAHQPVLKPWLQRWCAQVGCTLSPLRVIESLQVDNATLLRTNEGPGRYRLNVGVLNRGDVGVAWPHVELTLTDAQGTVLARRSFSVAEAQLSRGEGQPTGNVPDTVPPRDSTTLTWPLRLDGLQPAGYTAELFYP